MNAAGVVGRHMVFAADSSTVLCVNCYIPYADLGCRELQAILSLSFATKMSASIYGSQRFICERKSAYALTCTGKRVHASLLSVTAASHSRLRLLRSFSALRSSILLMSGSLSLVDGPLRMGAVTQRILYNTAEIRQNHDSSTFAAAATAVAVRLAGRQKKLLTGSGCSPALLSRRIRQEYWNCIFRA